MVDTLHTTLRELRTARGLSQSALAEQVYVSRQALWAVESGRQVPSTALALRLARVLDCTVEALFSLPDSPSVVARPIGVVESGARVRVARVDDALVAFKAELSERADGVATVSGDALHVALFAPAPPDRVLVAGCAPLIGLAAQHAPTDSCWLSANSADALAALAAGLVHIAGVHLEATGGKSHAEIVRGALPFDVTLVNLTTWRVGLLTRKDSEIARAEDVAASGVRCAQREDGAAVKSVQQRLLGTATGPLGRSHDEVARLVRWGLADVGVAIEPAALEHDLRFIPLLEERFDLVVPSARLADERIAQFVDTLERRTFRADAAACAGYELSTTGHAVAV